MPVIFTNNRLVDYSDSEDDDDQIRSPPRKNNRAMVIYSDSEEEDSFDSFYTIKAKSEIESRKLKTKSKVCSVNMKKFPDKTSPVEFIPRLFQQMTDDIQRNCEAQETVYEYLSSFTEIIHFHTIYKCFRPQEN